MTGASINHLWQSTLFAVMVGLLAIAFRKNRAQVRYWLWFSASLKFLVPFSLLTGLGRQMEWAPAAKEMVSPAVTITMAQIALPLPETIPSVPSAPASTDGRSAAVLGLWMCGFTTIALIRFRGWLRIRAAVRSSTRIDLPVAIEVRSSPGLLEPGVVGMLHPILLLPAGIAERLIPAQLEAVLAHELCHVRRRDNLFASIHMVVEAVFWFHPIVWWIGARLVEERERACDEEVLSLGSEPRVYAEGILNVCKLYVESPLACVSGVTGSNLKKRVEAIMSNRVALRLNLAKKAALACAGVAALALPVVVGMMNATRSQAQSATAAKPKFEVASIRPCKDEHGRKKGGGDSSPGRLRTGCDLLLDENNLGLIQRAYVRFAGGHTNPFGILAIKGGPAWIRSEMYEINARAEGQPNNEMMQGPMLQALLEDRFKLKLHRETRESPVYALTLAKDDSKLKPFQEGRCIQMPLTFPLPPLEPGQRYCRVMISMGATPAVNAEGSTLGEFSKWLSRVLDRPVVDKTGITKRFDIHLEFSPSQATPALRGPFPDAATAAPEPTGATIFTAIQEQLGLKLVPAKAHVEYLVIDHVEKPSEN
jgi:bla regulator protein blaR1